MPIITVEIEDAIVDQLTVLAAERQIALDDLIREALNAYLAAQRLQAERYSFIGIGRSGKGNLSTQVDETLAQNADRREGWSL